MKKNLRTLAVLICAAFALCFTKCTKSPEDLIIGSWNIDDAVIVETYGDESETEHFGPEENETMVITFNKDNTMTQVETETEDGITHTSTTHGTYTLEDNKLTFIWGNDFESQIYDIETLNKQDLIISASESDMINDITYTATIRVYLKRK